MTWDRWLGVVVIIFGSAAAIAVAIPPGEDYHHPFKAWGLIVAEWILGGSFGLGLYFLLRKHPPQSEQDED